ncbi:hypothetical protein T440DRAFT_513990 [Plenodomus tracheiphilus IPT5]|uniref:Uncharacterized protein n=1 Tax=Plenodomus tracheiphilus IPT5 TaxID=1408161 RepID=A0A6A7BJH9_9PLEO|nr:hypothetical protein T440DRAFT_513990 [Plenodomus tracheiphilus IPT5]
MLGRFYVESESYVNSKEKITKKSKDKAKEKKTGSQMEYWSLSKVVNVSTKSPALSTEAYIVDVSGVHDSNAARAAVAQGYMKQFTVFITVIRSKTYGILITEAIGGLELEEEIARFENEQAQYTVKIKQVGRDIADFREEQNDYKAALNNASEEIEQWKNLQDSLEDGNTVYVPIDRVFKA